MLLVFTSIKENAYTYMYFPKKVCCGW